MGPATAFFICFILGGLALKGGAAALPVCFGLLAVFSGIIALVVTDNLNKAICVIFGQVALVIGLWAAFEATGLMRILGPGGVLTCCSMTVVSTLNLTSTRMTLMSFVWFLLLDIIFTVASLSPYGLHLAPGPVLAALASGLLGAVILVGPAVVGGVVRAVIAEKTRSQPDKFEWS